MSVDDKIYTTELEELKMVVKVDKPTEEEDARKAFDRNTLLIVTSAASKVNESTQRIIDQFFGSICVDFLENKCVEPKCKNNHKLPEVEVVRKAFEGCSLKQIDEVFVVALKYKKILDAFFELLAEMLIKNNVKWEKNAVRLIQECERDARSHSNYRFIAKALTLYRPQMFPYRAVRFLISHHTDSNYARDILMSMIVDTGPEIVRFMDYLQDVMNKQSIPPPIFYKILEICVMYQNPALPAFCLNNLVTNSNLVLTKKPEDNANITNFINLQQFLSEDNTRREQKLQSFLLAVCNHRGNQ